MRITGILIASAQGGESRFRPAACCYGRRVTGWAFGSTKVASQICDLSNILVYPVPLDTASLGVLKPLVRTAQGSHPTKMDTQAQIDFLATLRLSLKVLKKAEPGFSVVELRRMIENRIAELKAEASLQRKSTALEIACPVCKQRAGLPCISLPSKTQFGKKNDLAFESHLGGKKVVMRRPHWERIRHHRAAIEQSETR